ncbi:phage major capsid protein, P2 family [Escherichia coli]|uniref:phage major capsid protein, P2 family n=1 Tax=Escherichia coli TaxID=562 RepID=UPI00135EF241|nr:phage major capsid protein, P2 family [Escherichia coli]MXF04497.1 phage major capsid protein, P2 family [Escherichia coli]
MRNETRVKFNAWLDRQAEINNIASGTVHGGLRFSVNPEVEQRMENKIQDSDEFLKKVNSRPVRDQEGEKIGLDISGPIASTNSSTDKRREPRAVDTMDSRRYRCEQVNSDTYISYAKLDAWSRFPDFSKRLSDLIVRRRALDRIMVGFNGTSHAEQSDFAKNPLLQDVNVGWLEHYRKDAPKRVMKDVTITSRDDDNKVIKKGDYGNLDSLAMDARRNLLDPWYIESPELVVITGRTLLNQRDFPILNALSQTNPNTEAIAGQLLVAQRTLDSMPVYVAPFFPEGTMLITSFSNLSLYWQMQGNRRMIREEPEYNRIATYSSSNDAYVVEDYGFGCLIEGITWAGQSSEG